MWEGVTNSRISFVWTGGRLAGFADVNIAHHNAIDSWISDGSRRWSSVGWGAAGSDKTGRFARVGHGGGRWVGMNRVCTHDGWHGRGRRLDVKFQCTMVLMECSVCGACGEVVDVRWSEKDFQFRSISQIDLNSKSFFVEDMGMWVVAGIVLGSGLMMFGEKILDLDLFWI